MSLNIRLEAYPILSTSRQIAFSLPFNIRRLHVPFEHLAGHVARKGVHDNHIPDALEFGVHTAVGPLNQIRGVDLGSGQGYNRCDGHLSPLLIGNAEYGHFADVGILNHDLLDVLGVDVDAA